MNWTADGDGEMEADEDEDDTINDEPLNNNNNGENPIGETAEPWVFLHLTSIKL